MNHKRTLIADATLLGVTFVWGTTFIIVQNVLDQLTPLTFNAWRFLLAAAVLMSWQMMFASKHTPKIDQYSWKLIGSGLLLGTFLFAGYVCQTIGLLYTTASNAAFITGLSVVLVPVFSSMMLKKIPHRTIIAGVVFATIGLFFLTTRGQFVLNKGDLIVLVSAITFALHIIFTAKVTEQYQALSLTIVQLSAVALLAFAGSILFERGKAFEWQRMLQADVVAVVLFMAIFATAFAFLLQTFLQKETPATHVGIIYIMEPVFAAWTSAVFQNVRFGTSDLAGSLLILTGMLIAEWPTRQKKEQINSIKCEEKKV
ncbi:DMT family transporter [Sporolactobacillus sp. CPB3-1]|uniref:DMT family transporter n=1 Tax=Sporolactobacillus mangiferae TaxID=2940498 RepID=A0ABT0MA76_9BACL|nr:DMT family transporter [Sporolactobacillus mangiferae]MCL1631785.1 DMT family transporter [Sporolactobacillus mangiferae]